MKDSPFLSGILSADAIAALRVVAKSQASSFSDLVKVGGLDRTRDLRHADLSGTNLSHADLRGYDLTGADLRGAAGIRVVWDKTTIFDGADLGGSIFAAKARLDEFFAADERARNLLTSIGRESWSEQAARSAVLLMSDKFKGIAVPIVEALFYRTTDEFLKAELLRYVAPRMGSPRALREMLLTAVSDAPDMVALIRSALSLFRLHRMSHDPVIRQIALTLIDSEKYGIREQAVQFIMRTSATRTETDLIRGRAETGDHHFGVLYVAETARRLGDEYDLITRYPDTNAHFHLYEKVTPKLRNLIAQRWLRMESVKEKDQLDKPLAQRHGSSRFFDPPDIAARGKSVDAMWQSLEEHGIKFQWERDPGEKIATFEMPMNERK